MQVLESLRDTTSTWDFGEGDCCGERWEDALQCRRGRGGAQVVWRGRGGAGRGRGGTAGRVRGLPARRGRGRVNVGSSDSGGEEVWVRGEEGGASVGREKVAKGKNFVKEEERQLTRSVLHVTQDPIVGNGQKGSSFWERISVHYDDNRPGGVRPTRSLETKWGQIKHDVAKFIGVHQQCVNANRSGSSAADVLKNAEELYRLKHPKNSDFTFQHVWLMIKDVPRWSEGWVHDKQPTPPAKRKEPSTDSGESDCCIMEPGVPGVWKGLSSSRPSGSKMAKEELKQSKIRESALRAQAAATQTIAAATVRKNELMEEANLLVIMTLPSTHDLEPDQVEYLRLRRREELKKLKRRLAEEEAREANEPPSTLPVRLHSDVAGPGLLPPRPTPLDTEGDSDRPPRRLPVFGDQGWGGSMQGSGSEQHECDRLDLNLGNDVDEGDQVYLGDECDHGDQGDEGDHGNQGDEGDCDDQANQHDQDDQDEEFYANQEGSRGHGHGISHAHIRGGHTQFRPSQWIGGVPYDDSDQLDIGNQNVGMNLNSLYFQNA